MTTDSLRKGIILKGVGGFYTVELPGGDLFCRARGIFRKQKLRPLPGDIAEVSGLGGGEGWIEAIKPRKNSLVRPAVANVDTLFIVASMAPPRCPPLMIDKLIAVCELKDIKPVVCINKTDIDDGNELREIYKQAGFDALCLSAGTGEGIDALRTMIPGRVCVFAGQSGVGKSSIMNLVQPSLGLEVGGLSERIDRGRHTTRHTELFRVGGGYVADTPGFGDLQPQRFEMISKDDLPLAFREFAQYEGDCRFTGCSHTGEKGCAVMAAVERGEVVASRHASYRAMYDEVKNVKDWET